jgi:hypothetical protein
MFSIAAGSAAFVTTAFDHWFKYRTLFAPILQDCFFYGRSVTTLIMRLEYHRNSRGDLLLYIYAYTKHQEEIDSA